MLRVLDFSGHRLCSPGPIHKHIMIGCAAGIVMVWAQVKGKTLRMDHRHTREIGAIGRPDMYEWTRYSALVKEQNASQAWDAGCGNHMES